MQPPSFKDLGCDVTHRHRKTEEYRQAMEHARKEPEDSQSTSRKLELEPVTRLERLKKGSVN